VLQLDCTYKTNRFKMPLLNIIGVTNLDTIFTVAFCFMKSETQIDYEWALNQLRYIYGDNYPRVMLTDRELALTNAIDVKNCRKYWTECETEDWENFLPGWRGIVDSPSEAVYEQRLRDFREKYCRKPEALRYLKDTWLIWKEHLVSAWADQHMHLGHRTTSCIEGSHKNLKLYLQTNDGNLKNTVDKLSRYLVDQVTNYRNKLAASRVRLTHTVNIPAFAHLI